MLNRILFSLSLAIAITLFVLFAIACTPQPIEPTIDPTPTRESMQDAPKTVNANPLLDLDSCRDRVFYTPTWGQEHIKQCFPVGYSIYEQITNKPIRIEHTGAEYSIRPLNNAGRIGFHLPPVTLTPGTCIIEVDGFSHIWGEIGDYAVRAHYTIEGVVGVVELGGHPLTANSNYLARFTLNAPQAGVYNIAVYLLLVHPSMTADSFFTFRSIQVKSCTNPKP